MRSGRAQNCLNWAPPPASPASGVIKASAPRHATFLVRFTAGSRKGSTRAICGMPRRCWTSCRDWALAHLHARSGEPAQISGYPGKSDAFDTAIADFAYAYADQSERDHAIFKKAVRSGRGSRYGRGSGLSDNVRARPYTRHQAAPHRSIPDAWLPDQLVGCGPYKFPLTITVGRTTAPVLTRYSDRSCARRRRRPHAEGRPSLTPPPAVDSRARRKMR